MTGHPLGWQRPPRDIVPETTQPASADLAVHPVTITVPGEPIYDAAGDWIGMAEPEQFAATLALPFDRADLKRLGYLPTDSKEEPSE